MNTEKIEIKDTDPNAPLLPYLRRLFNTLNKELCLFYLQLNLPYMYSVPFIEQIEYNKNKLDNDETYISNLNKVFNRDDKVELVKTFYVYRHSREYCFIESCIDSVRISLKFFLKCEFERNLFRQLTIFMKKNSDHLRIVRKKPLDGFDISFLITNKLLNFGFNRSIADYNKTIGNKNMGKYDIIHFILKFVVDIDRQIQDKILKVTFFSRYYIRKLLEFVDLNTFYGQKEVADNKEETENNKALESEIKVIQEIKDSRKGIDTDNKLIKGKNNMLSSQLNDSIGRDAIVLKALKTKNRIKNLLN
ncbi:relation to actin related protein 2/3 (Arp2/3) complex subunit 4 [Cryptosporidium ryanae]|uniref:relation to actin related protein 2/3 (Arp2/3) complex subunit 4 n=1 Tax=Cryptosporidium ryanae TaxID=515981 RepID=UPI00351A74D8|nr:relation to actin related protein 2/3 (Arp2/3) complex subunit 4 [Cryptosporidium ryanae]